MAEDTAIAGLARLIAGGRPVLVLTGAGISTASGIPPYRDHQARWLGSEPIQHQAFVQHEESRRRYWARSAVGWPAVARAEPNPAHTALARLEALGLIEMVVTQNVDRLHQRAGQRRVIDLHGRLDRVVCLDCGGQMDRRRVQEMLLNSNPFLGDIAAGLAPDGDARVGDQVVQSVTVPQCPQCGGVLMPDVVFFGGMVPADRVQAVIGGLHRCGALLVVGSSLMVYSGFRFCRLAHKMGKPIALVNQGATRADDIHSLKISADCAETLVSLVAHIETPTVGA